MPATNFHEYARGIEDILDATVATGEARLVSIPIEQLNPLAQREVKVKRAMNVPGAFRGHIINAENIGQSSEDLFAIRKGATDEYCQAY